MITIRECQEQDYQAIYHLNQVLGYEFPIERTREQLSVILKRPTDKVMVACIGEKVVGYIQVSDYECLYEGSLKNVMGLTVDSNYQRQGVGKALLSAAEDWAKQQGCAGIRLNSGMSRKGAHAFYERCGYINQKDQKKYIKIFADE